MITDPSSRYPGKSFDLQSQLGTKPPIINNKRNQLYKPRREASFLQIKNVLMNKLVILLLYFLLTVTAFPYTTTGQVLDPAMIGSYIDRFNMQDKGIVCATYFKRTGKRILIRQYTAIRMSDKNIEEIYYFRWWTFRKHLKKTPDGVHRNRIPSGCPVGRKAQRHLLPCLVPLSGRQVAEVFRFPQRLCVLLAEGRR